MKYTGTFSAYNNESSPVHTTPDPLTGIVSSSQCKFTPQNYFSFDIVALPLVGVSFYSLF